MGQKWGAKKKHLIAEETSWKELVWRVSIRAPVAYLRNK